MSKKARTESMESSVETAPRISGSFTIASPQPSQLSVLIPVYNERYLVGELLQRVLDTELPQNVTMEVIVVDDGSTDGTRELLEDIAKNAPIRYIKHTHNQGKTAAILTALAASTGDFCIFQDADLEYDPNDYPTMLAPLLSGRADVVYGSRYLPREQRRALFFWHSVGNSLLTLLSNGLTDLDLTDMETCYKAFRTDLLKTIPIRSSGFGLEPEITMKVAKRGLRVYEVPINYHGRTYSEGKKITWKDGVYTLGVLLKYFAIDDLYQEDVDNERLKTIDQSHRFSKWMADVIRPYLGHKVMEVGAGLGSLVPQFLPRESYTATESDREYLKVLRNLAHERPSLQVTWLDPADKAAFVPYFGDVDTIVCLNVLEHIEDDADVLHSFFEALAPGGRTVILVPQGKWLQGSLEESVNYVKRYSRREFKDLLEGAGFEVDEMIDFNRIGVIGWWLNSKLFQRGRIPKYQLKIYDSLVWFWRRFDQFLPWHGLSMIAIAKKPDRAG